MSADRTGLTGFCERGEHDACADRPSGPILHSGRGYNWYCVCTCHPEPRHQAGPLVDFQKALAVWKRHREAISDAQRLRDDMEES